MNIYYPCLSKIEDTEKYYSYMEIVDNTIGGTFIWKIHGNEKG